MTESYKLVYTFILDNEKKFNFTIRKAQANPQATLVMDLANRVVSTRVFSSEFLGGEVISVEKVAHVKTTEKEFTLE